MRKTFFLLVLLLSMGVSGYALPDDEETTGGTRPIVVGLKYSIKDLVPEKYKEDTCIVLLSDASFAEYKDTSAVISDSLTFQKDGECAVKFRFFKAQDSCAVDCRVMKPEPPDNNVANEETSVSLFRVIDYVLLGCIVLLIAAVVYLFPESKKRKENTDNDVIGIIKARNTPERLYDYNRFMVEHTNERLKIDGVKKGIADLDNKMQNVEDKISKIERKLNERNDGSRSNVASAPVVKIAKRYADSIMPNGNLANVSEQPGEDCTFVLTLKNGPSDTQATVTVYEGAYERISANPAFLEGCDYTKSRNAARPVTVDREGSAQLRGGVWTIVSKPVVTIR